MSVTQVSKLAKCHDFNDQKREGLILLNERSSVTS